MQSIPATSVHSARPGRRGPGTVFVDCLDIARQDLITLWLANAGYSVQAGLPRTNGGDGNSHDVLFTDRFGPGLQGEIVIAELKARHPALRVFVVGNGNGSELAQLSLARVAGADATLATPFDREGVLQIVEHA